MPRLSAFSAALRPAVVLLLLLLRWLPAHSVGPAAHEVPSYRVRVRVVSVAGKPATADQQFRLALAGAAQPAAFAGTAWSAWVASTPAGIAQAVAAYPNTYISGWQLVTNLTVTPTVATPFPTLRLLVESAIGSGQPTRTDAELFGPSVGLILWKDTRGNICIDTFTGHGRRVYDRALRDAFLPVQERPQKIIFGDRYIGNDNDVLSWREGIRRLSGLGFNALHTVPANLTATVRQAGITRLWGAVYNPPGYAFNFSPTRHADFVRFVQEQVNPALAAGWRKEDLAFWVTSDEPGWYYPDTYEQFNKDPNALAAFHAYLQQQGLSPQAVGKKSWAEVRLIGRAQYIDLASQRLYYWSNRFGPWASAQFFAEVARAYEEVVRPGLPVLVNFNNFMGLSYQPGPVGNNPQKQSPNAAMGQHDWLEFGRARGTTAISTEDWFGDDLAYQWSFYAARLRAAADLGGVGVGALVIPRVSGQRPGGMAQKLLALVGNGAKTIEFFTYGPEYNFPTNCYSENLAVFKPLATGMHLVAKAEDLLYPGRARPSEVAILTPQSAPLWDQASQPAQGLIDVTNSNLYGGRMGYMAELYSLYLAIQHSAIPVRFVDEQKLTEPDFGAVKVLYLTAPDLPAESTAALLQWVRNGGTLVTVAGAAEFDRYHQPLAAVAQAAGFTPTPPALRMPLLQLTDAQANGTLTYQGHQLAVFGEREAVQLSPTAAPSVAATFPDGAPALLTQTVGKGRILRFACYPGLSYRRSATGSTGGLLSGFSAPWRELITQPVRTARATLPVTVGTALVEAPALYCPAGVAVTLLNWSGTPQPAVTVQVATDRVARRVVSATRGPLRFTATPDKATVTLPLGEVDVVQVYY